MLNFDDDVVAPAVTAAKPAVAPVAPQSAGSTQLSAPLSGYHAQMNEQPETVATIPAAEAKASRVRAEDKRVIRSEERRVGKEC